MMFSNANRGNQQGPNRIGNGPTQDGDAAPTEWRPFTPQEDEAIICWVRDNGARNWEGCAALLGTGRSADVCRLHFDVLAQRNFGLPKKHSRKPRKSWNDYEDELIRAAVAQFGGSLVCNWEQVAAQVPGRNPGQCRERWRGYLVPGRSKAEWTDEEDRRLTEKVGELGHKWTTISNFFDGRTDVDCRNRWCLLERRAKNKSAITAPQVQQVQDVVPPTLPNFQMMQPMMMQASQFGFQPQVVAPPQPQVVAPPAQTALQQDPFALLKFDDNLFDDDLLGF